VLSVARAVVVRHVHIAGVTHAAGNAEKRLARVECARGNDVDQAAESSGVEIRRERLEGPQLLHCVAWDDLQVDFAGALTVSSGRRDGRAVERDGDELRMGPAARRELTNVIVVDGGQAGDAAEGFGNGNVGERADLIARQ